ncbi:hypothetical protein ACOME3_008313 [Neoechinorhynchus agilis]
MTNQSFGASGDPSCNLNQDDSRFVQGRINQLGGHFVNGRPLPPHVRKSIVELSQEGVKPCDISRILRVSHGCVSKILNRFNATGSIMPGSHGINKLEALHPAVIEQVVMLHYEHEGDISAQNIRKALVERRICSEADAPTTSLINRIIKDYALQDPNDMGGESRVDGRARRRRNRTNFTSEQLHILESNFQLERYPGANSRDDIARRTGLSESTVQVWFSNRRARERKGEQVLRMGQMVPQQPPRDDLRYFDPARYHEMNPPDWLLHNIQPGHPHLMPNIVEIPAMVTIENQPTMNPVDATLGLNNSFVIGNNQQNLYNQYQPNLQNCTLNRHVNSSYVPTRRRTVQSDNDAQIITLDDNQSDNSNQASNQHQSGTSSTSISATDETMSPNDQEHQRQNVTERQNLHLSQYNQSMMQYGNKKHPIAENAVNEYQNDGRNQSSISASIHVPRNAEYTDNETSQQYRVYNERGEFQKYRENQSRVHNKSADNQNETFRRIKTFSHQTKSIQTDVSGATNQYDSRNRSGEFQNFETNSKRRRLENDDAETNNNQQAAMQNRDPLQLVFDDVKRLSKKYNVRDPAGEFQDYNEYQVPYHLGNTDPRQYDYRERTNFNVHQGMTDQTHKRRGSYRNSKEHQSRRQKDTCDSNRNINKRHKRNQNIHNQQPAIENSPGFRQYGVYYHPEFYFPDGEVGFYKDKQEMEVNDNQLMQIKTEPVEIDDECIGHKRRIDSLQLGERYHDNDRFKDYQKHAEMDNNLLKTIKTEIPERDDKHQRDLSGFEQNSRYEEEEIANNPVQQLSEGYPENYELVFEYPYYEIYDSRPQMEVANQNNNMDQKEPIASTDLQSQTLNAIREPETESNKEKSSDGDAAANGNTEQRNCHLANDNLDSPIRRLFNKDKYTLFTMDI